MATIVVMTGGGIRAAVAAAQFAADNALVMVHVDFGQAAASAQRRALDELLPSFPTAKLLPVELPYVERLAEFGGAVGRAPDDAPSVSHESIEPTDLAATNPLDPRGLLPVLACLGVHCAVQLGASCVVTGLTEATDDTGQNLLSRHTAREFLHAMNIMTEAAISSRAGMEVAAPLVDLTYAEVVRMSFRYRVPLERTWSCLLSRPKPCGRCGGCKARADAFVEAKRADPLVAHAVEAG